MNNLSTAEALKDHYEKIKAEVNAAQTRTMDLVESTCDLEKKLQNSEAQKQQLANELHISESKNRETLERNRELEQELSNSQTKVRDLEEQLMFSVTQAYVKDLFNRIEVEAHLNMDGLDPPTNFPAPPIKGQIRLDWSLDKVTAWIGKEIDCDPSKILLWKVSQPTEMPTIYISDSYNNVLVKDMLSLTSPNSHDPRAGRCYKLLYSKLPVRVDELEHKTQVRIQALYGKFQLTKLQLFPEKGGTVQNLLCEAKKVFKFSENGTAVLRLVHVAVGAKCMRVFQVFPKDQLINEIYMRYSTSSFSHDMHTLRVEEVPEDQLEVGPGEHLLPVAHYDKERSRMFGVPFFIKIANEEKVSNIKRRIKVLLDVPDKEFKKYKFTIVLNSWVVRELNDENAVVTLSELAHSYISPTSAPYLGIDHLNKSRGMRGWHSTDFE